MVFGHHRNAQMRRMAAAHLRGDGVQARAAHDFAVQLAQFGQHHQVGFAGLIEVHQTLAPAVFIRVGHLQQIGLHGWVSHDAHQVACVLGLCAAHGDVLAVVMAVHGGLRVGSNAARCGPSPKPKQARPAPPRQPGRWRAPKPVRASRTPSCRV